MVPAEDSNERDKQIDRQLRSLNRRLERLEDTQITSRELNRGFEQTYEEIDHLEDKVDRLQSEFGKFRHEINDEINQVNQKLDTILRHVTRMN